MGLHEIKTICTPKQLVTILKRQPTEWEKTFASYTSDKKSITRIYRKLKKLSSPKLNDLMNWANKLNRAFLREKSKWPKIHEEINAQQPWPKRKCKSKQH
jgi:hypothetical protein